MRIGYFVRRDGEELIVPTGKLTDCELREVADRLRSEADELRREAEQAIAHAAEIDAYRRARLENVEALTAPVVTS